MNCMETQEIITSFINNKLNIREASEFLEHIKNCMKCQEELEVYYTLLTAMQQLDEDKDLSDNYSEELKHKIEYWENKIRRQKMQKLRRRFAFLFMIIGMGMIFGIEIGGKIAPAIEENKKPETEPSFILMYSGVPAIKDNVGDFIRQYDNEVKEYIIKRELLRNSIRNVAYHEWNKNRMNFIANKKQ